MITGFFKLTGLTLLIILLTTLACCTGYFTYMTYNSLQALERNGQVTQGQITYHSSRRIIKENRYEYTVAYSYSLPAPGSSTPAIYERRAQVPRQTFERLAIGSTVTIRYLPDNPGVVRMEGESEDSMAFYAIAGATAILLLGLPFLIWRAARLITPRSRRQYESDVARPVVAELLWWLK